MTRGNPIRGDPEAHVNPRPSLVLLDGGTGHELKSRGVESCCEDPKRFFMAGALANELLPELVIEVHVDYLKAGADVLTTNSFVVVPSALATVDREDDLQELIRRAVRNAKEAIRRSRGTALVAGCVPPLMESYMPCQVPQDAETKLAPTYNIIAEVYLLTDLRVDVSA